jgi:hypothetical protein
MLQIPERGASRDVQAEIMDVPVDKLRYAEEIVSIRAAVGLMKLDAHQMMKEGLYPS